MKDLEMIKSPEYKIRKIREIRNYSQDYIAQHLGLSVRAYSKIETGETQLTIKRLNQISEILEVTPLQILGFDEKRLFEKDVTSSNNTDLSIAAEGPVEYFGSKIQQLERELHHLRTSFQDMSKQA